MKEKKFLSILIPMFLIISFCAYAFSQDSSSAVKTISDIRVKGNSSVSTSTILSRLKLKPGDVFEENALNKELKRLYATGYFADVFVEVEDNPEGVIVIFTVVEKPMVKEIEFRGNARLKSERLADKVSVKKGTLLDFHVLSEDVSALETYYTEQGFSRVEVSYNVETDPVTGEAVVIFVIKEGYVLKVKTITFEGNNNIPSNELKKYMATKPAWLFIQKGVFDEDKFQEDIGRLSAVYRSKGFLDVKLFDKIGYSVDGTLMYISIVIEEGKKYLVGKIGIEGELAFPEKETAQAIKVNKDDAFDFQKLRDDMDNIRTFYYNKGYMDAQVDLQHKYNATTDRMDITYIIKANNEVFVGKINITGNNKTKDKVIRRELRVYPGEKYSGEKLKRSKERLYNMGFFEDVYLDTASTREKDIKDLNVTVKETKTGEFSFGGGYSSVDAFIGFVQIRQKNFDIANFPYFTGAGQDLVVRAEAGSARTNYFLGWTDPWIFDYPLLLGFDLYRQEHERYGTSGYDYAEERTGGSLRLGKELTEHIGTGLVYNLEEVAISDIPDNASLALKEERGENYLSRLTWNLRYDTRDNVYSPSRGSLTNLSLENAGSFLGGDKDFVKVFTYTSYYYSLLESVVLELSGRAGVVESCSDSKTVPIYERFFAGGAATIRGYKQRGIGPRDSSDVNLVVGGNSTVIGNAEITFPIFKNLIKGAVFYDVGSVMEEAEDLLSTADYKMGTGCGVRVKTPIGPIKLDYGYPLTANEGDKKEGQFYFSVSHGF